MKLRSGIAGCSILDGKMERKEKEKQGEKEKGKEIKEEKWRYKGGKVGRYQHIRKLLKQ